MSRNLCNGAVCAFCHGRVECVEAARPITKDDCGIYFPDYEGMIVAHAACVDCEAPYLAWLDGTRRRSAGRGWGWDYPRPYTEDGKPVPVDLSHRQAFNDEPGPADYPKHQMVRVRQPWPKCVVCDAPLRRPGGECDRVYYHKQGEK